MHPFNVTNIKHAHTELCKLSTEEILQTRFLCILTISTTITCNDRKQGSFSKIKCINIQGYYVHRTYKSAIFSV